MIFEVSGPTAAVQSPKSGCPSAESPYFDFELLFLIATATRDVIQSQKWFCTAFYGASMDKTTETVTSNFVPRIDCDRYSCALHKMLLVVFFHHRAFISLPQLSHSTNTGLSRASFSCLGQGDTECPAMACINSMAHVNCSNPGFRLHSLHDLCWLLSSPDPTLCQGKGLVTVGCFLDFCKLNSRVFAQANQIATL